MRTFVEIIWPFVSILLINFDELDEKYNQRTIMLVSLYVTPLSVITLST